MFDYNSLQNDITALTLKNSILDEINTLKSTALDDTIGLIPYGNTLVSLVKSCCDIPSMIFWSKMECFLKGIAVIPYEERQKFSEKFANENYKEFVKRLILLVDKIDDDRKAVIMSNLTRALMQELIDINTFFRLQNIVTNIVFEDLIFLTEHIRTHNLKYSVNIISLLNNSLAYQSVISSTSDNEYEISSLGLKLYVYGLDYDEYDKNRDIRERIDESEPESTVTAAAVFS